MTINLDINTWTVLNLIENTDVENTESAIHAAAKDRDLCGDLMFDTCAPGRQLDRLEELGFIKWNRNSVSLVKEVISSYKAIRIG